jgi:hypothetical protein
MTADRYRPKTAQPKWPYRLPSSALSPMLEIQRFKEEMFSLPHAGDL